MHARRAIGDSPPGTQPQPAAAFEMGYQVHAHPRHSNFVFSLASVFFQVRWSFCTRPSQTCLLRRLVNVPLIIPDYYL